MEGTWSYGSSNGCLYFCLLRVNLDIQFEWDLLCSYSSWSSGHCWVVRDGHLSWANYTTHPISIPNFSGNGCLTRGGSTKNLFLGLFFLGQVDWQSWMIWTWLLLSVMFPVTWRSLREESWYTDRGWDDNLRKSPENILFLILVDFQAMNFHNLVIKVKKNFHLSFAAKRILTNSDVVSKW